VKRLSVLGSTGSIGTNTLEVVRQHPDMFRIVALAVNNNIALLESQIQQFKPELVAVFDGAAAQELKNKDLPVRILSGVQGLVEAASIESADMVVSAIVGSPGLLPTFKAITAGKDVALATKEALVMAGEMVMAEAKKRNVRIIPVDSEHSAVFQCLHGRSMQEIKRIVLTASGGPFWKKSISELEGVTPSEALRHPNWDMGRKITIDSATLMNKGLEVIEACWLFDMPSERVDVLLHPQSIIHSMVEFVDCSMMAQLSVPDMKGPISYALSYPERFGDILSPLDLAELGELSFHRPDRKKYPSLDLTYQALREGGTMPCVLNAANEAAVEAFLDERISFTDIPRVISGTMIKHEVSGYSSIEEIIGVSDWSRETAEELIKERVGV
jgi:1-deoxy-D-xylulose-5-phosphate reductoisomerase